MLTDQDGQAAVAQRRPVVTGATSGGYIEIKEGLKAGEQLVRDGRVNNVQAGPVQLTGMAVAGAARPGQPGGARNPAGVAR